MSDTGGAEGSAAGKWLRAIGRVLLFLGLFALLLLAGSLLVPPGEELTTPNLVAQSALMLGAAVVAGIMMLLRFEERPAGALGFGLTRAAPVESVHGLVIGLAAIAIPVACLALAGTVRFAAEPGTAGAWLAAIGRDFALLAVAAAAEEALFRGYAFQVLVRGFGAVPAVLATSVVFSVAHGGNPNVDAIGLLNIFLAGIVLAIAYLRTRSLWFATAVHLGWNWGMASLLDLPVSGLEMIDTPLYEPIVSGAEWLSGGPFGPEGGIAGTAGFAIALLSIVMWRAVRERDETRAQRPLIDIREA